MAKAQREAQALEKLVEQLRRAIEDFPDLGNQPFARVKGKLPWPVKLVDVKKQLTATRLNEKDILVDLPEKAIDKANTVIVLELKTKPETDTVRFIAPNVPVTRLLAYDATQHGKGFGFGDGKTNRYYVEGWKKPEQSLSWNFRFAKPGRYTIMIKYLAGENSGGNCKLVIDEALDYNIAVEGNKNNQVITKTVGIVTASEGGHQFEIKPTSISKAELMKLLEIQLIPLDK